MTSSRWTNRCRELFSCQRSGRHVNASSKLLGRPTVPESKAHRGSVMGSATGEDTTSPSPRHLSGRFRGADRDRTDDLRLAKPALSQLSYSPGSTRGRCCCFLARLAVGQGRVELPTSRLSGVRSNHLSYWPGGASSAGSLMAPPRPGSARSLATQ